MGRRQLKEGEEAPKGGKYGWKPGEWNGGVARVLDLELFRRLLDAGDSIARMGRVMMISPQVIKQLKKGVHWQQQPAKVRAFNKWRGANLDEATGVAPPGDLAKWGKVVPKRAKSEARDLLIAAGHDKIMPEMIDRVGLLAGEMVDVPKRLDTAVFLGELEKKLWAALAAMDTSVIARASARDLSQMVSMLIERRALLRNEPTSIIRTDNRASLDKVAGLLVQEAKRRGIVLEGNFKEVSDGEKLAT